MCQNQTSWACWACTACKNLCFCSLVMLICSVLRRRHHYIRELSKDDVDNSENVIWKCNFAFVQNHFPIIQNHHACKMCSHYPGIKLEPAQPNLLTSSTQLQNRSFDVVERTRSLRNVYEWKMHVQSVQNSCFSLLNVQICDILVAVVVVA